MTRWPDGPPRAVPTPRSPSSHGADDVCGFCRDCDSCQGGTAVLPDVYRATDLTCTRCDGRAVTCHNLTTRETAPMIVTRGKLTVDQASRIAVTAECPVCGLSKVFLDGDAHTVIQHDCPVGAVGARWNIAERPSAPVRRELAAERRGLPPSVETEAAADRPMPRLSMSARLGPIPLAAS